MNHCSSSNSISHQGQQQQQASSSNNKKSRKHQASEEQQLEDQSSSSSSGNSVFFLFVVLLSYVNRSSSVSIHPSSSEHLSFMEIPDSAPTKLADPTGVYSPLKVSKSVPNSFRDFEREWTEDKQRRSLNLPEKCHDCREPKKPKNRTEGFIHSVILEKMTNTEVREASCPDPKNCSRRFAIMS